MRFYSDQEREELITQHLPKVKYIADRLATRLPSTVERDDLYGAGVLGLVDAVERFDPSRGIAFTTFAERRVRGAMLDNLRSLDWAPRNLRRRAREIRGASDQLEQETGRVPTDLEISERLNVTIDEVQHSNQELQNVRLESLDESDPETGLSLGDLIRDESASQADETEKSEFKRLLTSAVGGLPERERQVVALYYIEELTMKEIGAVLGVTESRVSQLRSQATNRLQKQLNHIK